LHLLPVRTTLEPIANNHSLFFQEGNVRNPLAAHPPWRRLLIVSIALPLAIVLAVLAFTWPTARVRPRDVPVGVVGASPATQQLVGRLRAAQPDAFDFRLYPDAGDARWAIRHRDIYGAFVVGHGRVDVLDASAAGPAVAQVLTLAGLDIARRTHAAEAVSDVVPLSAKDSKGSVLSSVLLPLTICSIVVAAAIGVVVQFRPAWRQLLALICVSVITGAGAYLIGQGWLGALPHDGVRDWAALVLSVLAIAAPTAGLIALIGASGLGVAAALFVFVGNPFAGASSAPELLPGAAHHLGQWLPPGAALTLLRTTAYFDGHGAGTHVGVLTAWTLAGFLAIVLGHHAPIRFAAARPATSPPSSDGRVETALAGSTHG
jgi:hypothetical protein